MRLSMVQELRVVLRLDEALDLRNSVASCPSRLTEMKGRVPCDTKCQL